jgi:hypothetical protein
MARAKHPRPLSPKQKARVEAAEYESGFAKPPSESQFRKGQSGNPSGRPRRPSTRTLLKNLLDQEVAVNTNGSPQRVSVRQALVQIVGANGLKGVSRDREFFFRLIGQHLPEEFQEEAERSLTPDQNAILRRFGQKVAEARISTTGAAEGEPSEEDWDIV